MVLSSPQGKPQERRRSSVSPRRENIKRKPRQGWLVALGQGHSPASTRRQEGTKSISPIRTKKFDVDSLSFSGLEKKDRQPRSPPGTFAHRPAKRPSVETKSSRATRITSAAARADGAHTAVTSSSLRSPDRSNSAARAQIVSRSAQPAAMARDARSTLAARRVSSKSASRISSSRSSSSSQSGRGRGRGDGCSSRVPGKGVSSPLQDQAHVRSAESGVNTAAAITTADSHDTGGFPDSIDVDSKVEKAIVETSDVIDTASAPHATAVGIKALSSLALASPGKDYWAGRIADGARESESPRANSRGTSAKNNTKSRRPQSPSPSSVRSRGFNAHRPGRRKGEQMRDHENNLAVTSPSKARVSLSPAAAAAGRKVTAVQSLSSTSSWSTQAFFTPGRLPVSPSSAGTGRSTERFLSFSPRGRGRLDSSPWCASTNVNLHGPGHSRQASFSPTWFGGGGGGRGQSGRAIRQHALRAGQDRNDLGSAGGRSGGGNGGGTSGDHLTDGDGVDARATTPGRDPLASSFGRGGRRVSPMRRQIPDGMLSPRKPSPTAARACVRRTSSKANNSPATIGSANSRKRVAPLDSPERTTSHSDSPERTGVASDDEGVDKSLSVFGGGDESEDVSMLKVEVDMPDDILKGGESPSPAARPSPLERHSFSPLMMAPEPSPSFIADYHTSDVDVDASGTNGAGQERSDGQQPSSEQSAATTTAAVEGRVRSDSRPPLHDDNGSAVNVHLPPGVRVDLLSKTASGRGSSGTGGRESSVGDGGSTSGREDSTGSASSAVGLRAGGRAKMRRVRSGKASSKLRVSTPTGDGGPSDLSLWITLRDSEPGEEGGKQDGGEEAEEGVARVIEAVSTQSPLPPVPSPSASLSMIGLVADDIGNATSEETWIDTVSFGTDEGRGEERNPLVSKPQQVEVVHQLSERETAEESVEAWNAAQGAEGYHGWQAIMTALRGMVDLCRPPSGDGGGRCC